MRMEKGFLLTNALLGQDKSRIKKQSYQKKLAGAIYNGMGSYVFIQMKRPHQYLSNDCSGLICANSTDPILY